MTTVGCARPQDDLAATTRSVEHENGMRLNGMRLNGMRLNGMRLNGMRLNGMRLNGMRLNGTALAGWLVDGTWIEGEDLIGVELVGILDDGSEVLLRVDDIRASTEPGDEDILYHTISVWDATESTWDAACGTDEVTGEAIGAIPLAGTWDYSEGTETGGAHMPSTELFTLGCADSALGKCAEWGYKPWVERWRCQGEECWMVDGQDFHQSCTRMVRADYCGDGRTWTEDGTLINVYDDVVIQDWDSSQHWTHEAEWGPWGANCLTEQRIGWRNDIPFCAYELQQISCGMAWEPQSLMMTDFVGLPPGDPALAAIQLDEGAFTRL